MAKSGYLSELAKIHGVSVSTVSRCIKNVYTYIASKAHQEIYYDYEPYVVPKMIFNAHIHSTPISKLVFVKVLKRFR